MKRIGWSFIGLVMGIFLTIGFLWIGSIRNALAEPSLTNRSDAVTATARLSDESGVAGTPSAVIGDDELPPANLIEGIQSPNAFPTPIPGETLVYFIPTDNDATATVIFLYNTDSVAHTVALRGYSYNGTLGYSLNINIPATSLLRLSSDSIAAAPRPVGPPLPLS